MFATDPHLQRLASAAAGGDGELDQLTNPLLVQHPEGIVGKYTTRDIIGEETAGIVAAETECGLRQVVRAE